MTEVGIYANRTWYHAETLALNIHAFVRQQTRVSYLDSIIGNSDRECVNELRMGRRTFGILCELLPSDGRVKSDGLVSVEEQSNDGDNAENEDVKSPMSVSNAGSRKSEVSKKGKRKRIEKDKLISNICVAIVESGKIIKQVADAIVKDNEDRSDIRIEIKKMGLPIMEQIEAMRIVMDKPQTISLFMPMDDEMRQVFVANLLAEQNPLRRYSAC